MLHLRTHSSHEDHPESVVSNGVQQEIRTALRDWRSHMAHGSELAEPLDPEGDHVRGDVAAPVAVVE